MSFNAFLISVCLRWSQWWWLRRQFASESKTTSWTPSISQTRQEKEALRSTFVCVWVKKLFLRGIPQPSSHSELHFLQAGKILYCIFFSVRSVEYNVVKWVWNSMSYLGLNPALLFTRRMLWPLPMYENNIPKSRSTVCWKVLWIPAHEKCPIQYKPTKSRIY